MMRQNLEFIIKGLVEGESGRLTVIGRCGDEPIRVDDVFDVVFRNKKRTFPEESGNDPVREIERPVNLRVECIHAYERSLGFLGQGMTGALVLNGDGREYVNAGWILGSHLP